MPCFTKKSRGNTGTVTTSSSTPHIEGVTDPSPHIDMSGGVERFAGRVAVVTGASGGIGAQLAEDLVRAGMVVVGVARRLDRLQALAEKLAGLPGRLEPLQADLSTPEGVQHAFKWVDDNLGGISVLVNNAAILTQTPIADLDVAYSEKLMFTNVTAVMIASGACINSMKKHDIKDGHIININSVYGHVVSAAQTFGPDVSSSAYSATKHATVALTKGLRADLQALKPAGFRTRVTSISPGAVNTDMLPEEYAKMVGEDGCLKPKDISNSVLFALGSPPAVEIVELTIQPTGEFV